MIFEKIKKWKEMQVQTRNCRDRISQCPKEELCNALEEIEKNNNLSKNKKKKLKAGIINKPDLPEEIISKMKEDKEPLIKWMVYERELLKK